MILRTGRHIHIVSTGAHSHTKRTGKITTTAAGTRLTARFLARHLTIVTVSHLTVELAKQGERNARKAS